MTITAQIRGAVLQALVGERAVQIERAFLGPRGRVEFFFQVDDPYSYLLAQVLGKLLTAAELGLEFVLVPAPPADFNPEPELQRGYALEDAKRLTAAFELAFPTDAQPPTAERVGAANAILAVTRPSQEQLEVALRVAAALWGGDDLQLLRQELGATTSEPVLERNDERRRRAGHYLSGMLRYRGVWYWGIDRLRHLRWHWSSEGREVPDVLVTKPAEPLDASSLEMFFSFRSPYAYVGAVRAIALCEERGIPLLIRPILPAVMRGLKVPFRKRLYIARDTAREARHFGVPFGKICDPLGPGIARCLAVFQCAREAGRESAFVQSIGRGVWAEAHNVANDADFRVLVERAGVSWSAATQAIEQGRGMDEAEENRRALYELGMWGVPSFRAGDVHVWGNDRLDMLARRLEHSE